MSVQLAGRSFKPLVSDLPVIKAHTMFRKECRAQLSIDTGGEIGSITRRSEVKARLVGNASFGKIARPSRVIAANDSSQ